MLSAAGAGSPSRLPRRRRASRRCRLGHSDHPARYLLVAGRSPGRSAASDAWMRRE